MAAISQTRPSTAIRTPLFILGIALALLAFLAMFAFGILFANRSQSGRTVSVVVAAQDIQPREPILPEMLTFSTVSATASTHAFLRPTDLAGYSALVGIYNGQVITTNEVAASPDQITAGGASSFLPIPEGYVAMTLPTSEQQGVAGYPAQGDYLDVIATINTGIFSSADARQVVRTVFNDLPIIRVGPSSIIPKQGQPQGVASSLTVVMTLCDAQFMQWLITNATLKYVLLSYKDYASQSSPVPASTCPATDEPAAVGPRLVDARWGFTKG